MSDLILWTKPNGTQVRINDSKASVEEALRLGWVEGEGKKVTVTHAKPSKPTKTGKKK